MELSAVEAFLASQEAGFKSFLKECTNLDYYDIERQLSLHTDNLINVLRDTLPSALPEGTPKPVSATTTPTKQTTPNKVAIPTHTPAGKRLKQSGAGTMFRAGSGIRRRAAPESDSSPEATEVNTMPNDDSSVRPPHKRRLVSAAQIRDKAIDNTVDTAADNVQDEPAQPKSSPRGHVASGKKTRTGRLTNPFVCK